MAGFRLRRCVGWCFAGLALLFLAASVLVFAWRPDRLAAFTTMPFWVWAIASTGFVLPAAILLKQKRWLWIAALWGIATLIQGEEWRLRWWLRTPPAAATKPAATIRVLTLNCAAFQFGDPAADIAKWQPDVILLQEVAPAHMQHIAQAAFGKTGTTHFDHYQLSNAIISRWPIQIDTLSFTTNPWHCQRALVMPPNGKPINLINLHLSSASTDLRLWKREAWRAHRATRTLHRYELNAVLARLATTPDDIPCLIGGDFNAAANDPLHRMLKPRFTDTMHKVGSGWPDTFQRRAPVLRIDYLYHNRALTGVSCRAMTTFSDHRMVVADFLPTQTAPPPAQTPQP